MSNESRSRDALDPTTVRLLGDAPAAGTGAPAALREAVLARVAADAATMLTVRGADGDWTELLPGIRRKLLFSDPESGTEAFLLRAEPGARLPPHGHDHDEHCLVLEGDVGYGETIRLGSGDYHLARRGSEHAAAHTETGALVYIQNVRIPPGA